MEFRRSIHLMTQLMSIIGINPLKPDTYWQCYFRLFLCCIFLAYGAFCMFSYTYCSENNFYNISLPVSYGSCTLMFLVNILYLQKHKMIVRDLLQSINKNVFNYLDEENFDYGHQLEYVQEKRFVNWYELITIGNIVTVVVIGLKPIIGYITDEWHTFMYAQCVPWQTDSAIAFLLTHLQQIPTLFSAVCVVNLHMVYYVFIWIEFDRQYDRLNYAIETINERTRLAVLRLRAKRLKQNLPFVNMDDSDYFNGLFKRNLVMCVRHHQEICKMYMRFKVHYEADFSAQLFIIGTITSVTLYMITRETSVDQMINLLIVMGSLFFSVFLRCFVGEQISSMNQRIQNALFYETEWHLHSVKNKKLISIFHALVSRPLELKGFGRVVSSFPVFYSFVKVSYSYFNLLRSSV